MNRPGRTPTVCGQQLPLELEVSKFRPSHCAAIVTDTQLHTVPDEDDTWWCTGARTLLKGYYVTLITHLAVLAFLAVLLVALTARLGRSSPCRNQRQVLVVRRHLHKLQLCKLCCVALRSELLDTARKDILRVSFLWPLLLDKRIACNLAARCICCSDRSL